MDYCLGDIRLFAGDRAPNNFEFCEGQELSMYQYQGLYALIGITYGGHEFKGTFCLPDLRGHIPVQFGNQRFLGKTSLKEMVSLQAENIPDLELLNVMLAQDGKKVDKANENTFISSDKVTDQYEYNILRFSKESKNNAILNDCFTTDIETKPFETYQSTIALNYIICTVGDYPQISQEESSWKVI